MVTTGCYEVISLSPHDEDTLASRSPAVHARAVCIGADIRDICPGDVGEQRVRIMQASTRVEDDERGHVGGMVSPPPTREMPEMTRSWLMRRRSHEERGSASGACLGYGGPSLCSPLEGTP